MTATPNPPTPRRCRRILEAHHLDCQGLSPDAIAEKLRCARSTVYAYFRDFQLHRAHILRTVAADRLADQVHILTTPDTDPDQHRQTVAATRELRLLLTALPKVQADDHPSLQEADTAAEIEWARSRTRSAGPDGHARLDNGRCADNCPRCRPDIWEGSPPWWHYSTLFSSDDPVASDHPEDPDEPGITEPEPDQSSPKPDESAPIQTNLDKSGHQIDENPAHNNEFASTPQNSPPEPRQPRNWPRITAPQRPNRSVVIPLPDIGRY
ncbi:MAG: TetR/AcrR family transcriptional regulator [Chloroflexota bacterium]|nr:TetR/AcrR family transcriptional regulator [Chloroflexota bacterium]